MVDKPVQKEITFKKNFQKMPKDIRDFYLAKQTEIKTRINNQFSFEETVYSLTRSHPEFIKFYNK